VSQNSKKNSTTLLQWKQLRKPLKLRLSDDEDRELHIQDFFFAIPLRLPLLLSQNLNKPTKTTTQRASARAQRNQMRREQARGHKSQEGSQLPTYLPTYLPTHLTMRGNQKKVPSYSFENQLAFLGLIL
jgi:hypothetical protein